MIEFWSGKISLRKLYVLVYGLPNTSRCMAKLSGDDKLRRWGDAEHVLANIQDTLGMLYRLSWIAGQIKGKPPQFDPVNRPGVEKPTGKDMMDPAAIDYLNMFSPGVEAQPIPAAPEEDMREEHTSTHHKVAPPGRGIKQKPNGQ